jgi:hypothetical protein
MATTALSSMRARMRLLEKGLGPPSGVGSSSMATTEVTPSTICQRPVVAKPASRAPTKATSPEALAAKAERLTPSTGAPPRPGRTSPTPTSSSMPTPSVHRQMPERSVAPPSLEAVAEKTALASWATMLSMPVKVKPGALKGAGFPARAMRVSAPSWRRQKDSSLALVTPAPARLARKTTESTASKETREKSSNVTPGRPGASAPVRSRTRGSC